VRVAILGSRGFPSTYGGFETLVRYLAREWHRQGHDVTVYCRERPEAKRSWNTEGIRCRYTPGWESTALSTLSFGATAHLDASVRRFDAVLVLNVANGFYLPLLNWRNVPCAVNTDGVEWERGKWSTAGKKVFLAGARLTARRADVLICDSQAIGQLWKAKFGVDSTFIPYGAPVLSDVGTDRLDELGIEPQTYALVVARLIPENNVERIVDALALSRGGRRVVVVGSASGPSQFADRLQQLEAAGDLRWLGHVSDQELLKELWANCGTYVHGHSVGGTNPGLLQALGAGAPTLALDTVFNREVIAADDQMFAFENGDLARRVDHLLSDSAARDVLRERGQATIAERYNWQTVCDDYMSTLELAIDRHLTASVARR
jgi:glycosyltransferase involved in cell wall biosynthesis